MPENRTFLNCFLLVTSLNIDYREVMSMYVHYNPNPKHQNPVGDCVIRAVSKALNISWETAFIDLVSEAYEHGDLPSSNAVLDSYLRSKGFRKYTLPNECPDCYTFADFAGEHFRGTYIVCTGSHVACIKILFCMTLGILRIVYLFTTMLEKVRIGYDT